jgi:deoxyribose-phosphate aldolase
LLRPDATREQVLRVAAEAAEHRFASICIPPCYVEEAVQALVEIEGGSAVPVGTVVAFPLGYAAPRVRLEEARRAVEQGARELDTVINVSRLKSGDAGWVLDDLTSWVEALRAYEVDLVLKVILETALLTDQEKGRAAGLVVEAGADFVKTSTGKISPAATLPVTLCMMEVVRDVYFETGRMVGIKPAGGIRVSKQAVQYLVVLYETLGGDWMTPDLFRFGASSLLNDVLMQIRKEKTGRYQSPDYFTVD